MSFSLFPLVFLTISKIKNRNCLSKNGNKIVCNLRDVWSHIASCIFHLTNFPSCLLVYNCSCTKRKMDVVYMQLLPSDICIMILEFLRGCVLNHVIPVAYHVFITGCGLHAYWLMTGKKPNMSIVCYVKGELEANVNFLWP